MIDPKTVSDIFYFDRRKENAPDVNKKDAGRETKVVFLLFSSGLSGIPRLAGGAVTVGSGISPDRRKPIAICVRRL